MTTGPDLPRRGPAIRVFLLALCAYSYFFPRWADWNQDSRFDLTRAIVDLHSLKIDRFGANTWDKAVFAGHTYSDKAPGTAILGAAVYSGFSVVRSTPLLGDGLRHLESNKAWDTAIRIGRTSTQNAPAPKGTNLGGCRRNGGGGNVQFIPWGNRLYPPFRDWALSKYVTTVGAVALPAAAFLAFFFWFLGLFTRRRRVQWTVTGVYGFGSVALPYSTVFYSHQLSAACLFTAFSLLYLVRNHRAQWPAVVGAGFLLGFALFTELTVAIAILGVGAYGLWVLRNQRSFALGFVAAGLVPVAALAAYNFATFGRPFDSGYSHDFCWSAAQGAGYAGFTYPHLDALFDLTFGPFRGLFFTSPVLLFAAVGAAIMLRRGIALEGWVCIVIAMVFILAISSYWGWNGGQVDGPRYLVPIVPFLAFPVVFVIDRYAESLPALFAIAILGLWSVAATWIAFLGGELFPHSGQRFPLWEYSIPALHRNEIAPNLGMALGLTGWTSLLPLLAMAVLILVARRKAQESETPPERGRRSRYAV